MSQDTIAAIEKEIAASKELVEYGNAVERLRSNRDFKKVIVEGYFEKESIRLVHLLANPAMQTPTSQSAILVAMQAIGNLSQYLIDAVRTGEIALKQIGDNESVRDELLAEELAE